MDFEPTTASVVVVVVRGRVASCDVVAVCDFDHGTKGASLHPILTGRLEGNAASELRAYSISIDTNMIGVRMPGTATIQGQKMPAFAGLQKRQGPHWRKSQCPTLANIGGLSRDFVRSKDGRSLG